jgi:hypothetical protein
MKDKNENIKLILMIVGFLILIVVTISTVLRIFG